MITHPRRAGPGWVPGPTKAAPSLPSSAGQGTENRTKVPRVAIRTGRDHSPITATGKTINSMSYKSNEK